ncbi:MAG: hypothetical protein WCT47_09090 [Betaproteobacteria bacterium]|jgi:hypothetical protein
MHRLFFTALVMTSLTGCGVIAEFAYDDALEKQRRACDRIPDRGDYRLCIEKVREAERQAEASRKGN